MTARNPGPAVVLVAVHDGFYGCGTGAGRSNRAFLSVLTGMLSPTTRLITLPVRLIPASGEYDRAWHQETLAILAESHGEVVPVDNGTAGLTRFGGLAEFRVACASAATSIKRLIPCPSRALIVAFDVPFYGLAPLLAAEHRVSLVNVARSTASLHTAADRERIAWERSGLQAAAAGGHVAAISHHMRDHLTTSYQIPLSAIVNLTNGLTPAEQHRVAEPDPSLLPPPAHRGFLLSLGRAEPYKGFDDLLDALHILKTDQDPPWVPHTILAAVAEGSRLTPYQEHLVRRVKAEALDVTLHTTFSPGVRGLLSHSSLSAVIVPSRAEPFGRVPLEAFAAGAPAVVATTAGGLAEVVIEGQTGYTARPADSRSLAAAIRRALAASPARRARMLATGRGLVASSYAYESNVRAFLTTLAPWAIATAQST
jgi:glycosyltransferase involved in cell wall biosynthesis